MATAHRTTKARATCVRRGATALTATLAAGALASAAPNREVFVQNLWNIEQQRGCYRYYQESVYLLGLLATAGRMRYDLTGVE
jgi:hypothetical protein